MNIFGTPGEYGLENHGLYNLAASYWNLSPAKLVEHAISHDEGRLSSDGALIALTGKHTGRSPNDKYVVKYPDINMDEIWWGKVNKPISPEYFDRIFGKLQAYFQGREVFVQDLRVGAHPSHTLPIRIITEKAWHNLFASHLFISVSPEVAQKQIPQFTVIQSENFRLVPEEDGTCSETFIIVNFPKKVILIGGTGYAGEIKKSIFTIMNYLMPRKGILSMHCSANVSGGGDVALFFGLSGTGKTTLSSDPDRHLIGDDEHGWSDEGIFNFEGGCYAKTIKLNKDLEPIIWNATHRFGAVIENVDFNDTTRQVDFDSAKITENTRGAYPLDYVPSHVSKGYAGHPENVFFLTADAFGVLPPIAKLSPAQAMYYFLSGYTSKLAGTETGLGNEPQATFSTCFGSPFLPLHPSVYAGLLGKKIEKHGASVWLVNTGWSGGPYGIGARMSLPYTRAIIKAALTHQLDNVSFSKDNLFGLNIPLSCPGVPAEVLDPIKTWNDPEAYTRQAKNLINQFEKNFKQYADKVSSDVIAESPHP
jgi:phosphoenolpyruvate carboxykinase (ATP)